jgi:TolA-binding protein
MRTPATLLGLLGLLALLLAGAAPPEEPPAVSLYRQGKVHYDHDRFDQALQFFDQVVRGYPENPLAAYAANLSLDILNLKKDYAGLEKLARRYAADRVLMQHESLREIVPKILPHVALKQAQRIFDEKKYPEAAEAFLRVADEFPESDIAGSALYNAALSYEKAGIQAKVLEIHRRLVRQYPKSGLARRCGKLIKNSKKE